MDGKRGIYFGLVFLAVILASSIVFGQEDPDLAPFDASVTIENAPPVITFLQVIDNVCPNAPCIDDVDPLEASVNNAEVRFVATDPNGPSDLPGGTQPISQALAVGDVNPNAAITGANIEVFFTSPIFGTEILAEAGTCAIDPLCPNCLGDPNAVEYTCTVPMEYFYEPGVNTWTVDVAVADVADTIAIFSSVFTYTILAAFVNTGGVGWNTPSINLGGVDQEADGPVDVTSTGNVDFITGDLTGRDLTPNGAQTGDNMPVNAFGVGLIVGGSNIGACDVPDGGGALPFDGTELADNVAVSVLGINLPFGDGIGGPPPPVGEQAFFCIWEQLDTLGLTFSEPSYSATTAKGIAWRLDLFVV